jgi:DNA modification methylase
MDLKNGDCIDLIKDIKDESVNLIFTSPPYWKGFAYESYFNSYKQYLDWCEIWIKNIKDKLKDDGYFLLNISNDSETTVKAFELLNICLKYWKLCDTIIWFVYNRQPANTNRQLTNQTEYIFMLRKHNNNINIRKERIIDNDAFITKNIGNVWKIPFNKSQYSLKKTCGGKKNWGHSGYPKKLCDIVVKLFSDENDIILDIFAGYCELGLSCKELNRKFIGFEKDINIYKDAKERLK